VDCFFILFGVGAVAVVLFIASKQRTAAKEAWRVAGRSLGLVVKPGGTFANPSIRGSLDGFGVAADAVTRGSGKNNQTYTRYRVHYPSLHLGLKLTKEIPVLSSLSKVFGGQDVEVGHRKFDDDVLVKGSDESRIRSFLDPHRRAIIHRFLTHHTSAEITDTHASFETHGLESNAITLQRNLSALKKLALDLQIDESDHVKPDTSPHLPDLEPPTPIAEIATAIGGVPIILETREDKRERRLRERAERVVRKMTGLPSDAPIEKDAAPEEAPEPLEPVVDEAPTPAESPDAAPVSEPVEEPEPEPAPEPPPAPDVSPQSRICNALFGKDLRIPDMKTLFANTYDGAEVRWTGRLKSMRHIYSDTVFGDVPGTRAEVIVAKVSAGMFGERDVVAVVHLPEEAEALLRERVGDEIAFTGALKSLDPFMREVYVAGGELLP